MPINSPDVFDSITNAKVVSGTGGGGVAEVQVQDSFGTTLNQTNTLKFLNKEFRVSAGGTNEGDVVLTGYQDIDTSSTTLGENGEANHFRFYNWQFVSTGVTGRIYSFYFLGSNQFRIADNNALNTTNSYLGIRPNITSAQTVILEGLCKVDTTNWSGSSILKTGAPVYLDSNGLTTDTLPSTAGDFVRVVGYIVDFARGIIYFKPDDTVIERK